MTEKNLRDYFDNKLTADELAVDLKGSQQKASHDVTTVYVDKLDDGEFEVTSKHLIKLCDDVISEKLSMTGLNTIAFTLEASDYFIWDSNSVEGERIANVIFEWDSPEIGFDLTIKNMQLWRGYLLTGEYKLDENELKQKFRSNGKYKELYQAIDEILWTDWDPIGVDDIAPRDEYQSYTPAILNLKIKGADVETIANKLHDIEKNTIGLLGNLDKCREVADKISRL